MGASEAAFKRWFMSNAIPDNWIYEFIEPSFGTHVGVADSVVGFWQNSVMQYVWIEFKLAKLSGADHVVLDGEVRPAQVQWHHKWRKAGATTLIIAGIFVGKAWHPIVLPDSAIAVPKPYKVWDIRTVKTWYQWRKERGL